MENQEFEKHAEGMLETYKTWLTWKTRLKWIAVLLVLYFLFAEMSDLRSYMDAMVDYLGKLHGALNILTDRVETIEKMFKPS
jgi:hypothetical protein